MALIDITTLPRRMWVTALPTSGTFNLGDRLHVTTTAAEYACTTAGVAGSTAVFTALGGSGSALTVQDENANVSTAVTQIDFQGAGVTTTAGSGEVVVTIPGSSGSALTVQDENTNVSTAVTQIDFQGAGVTTTAGSGEVVVTIPGGGGASADTWIYKTADTIINNSATLVADPHLTVSLAVGTYAFESFLHYTASTSGDIQLGWNVPSGTTMGWNAYAMLVGATGATSALSVGRVTGAQTLSLGSIGVAAPVIARPVGYLIVTTTGTVAMRWAQTVAEATDATLYTGSWVRFTKLA